MATRISILGSTGSIGQNVLQVVRRHRGRFEVVGLAAHSNAELLADQAREFRPQTVALYEEASAQRLAGEHLPSQVLAGRSGVEALAATPADVAVCAVVGAAGLSTVLNAIGACNRVALANKEALVMAGALVMARARAKNVPILPVDSEHSAIFQCLQGHAPNDVHRVHLTASGGPFYGSSRDALAAVTPAQATKHPNWDMGTKISVDSATLMNKGLEVIEAMWLFGLPLEKIAVIIHPQSIVHSMVEFIDGNILAHLGATDMKLPIQFALTWPERVQSPVQRLDLGALPKITFAAPDFSEFPCLALALDAAQEGGTAPAVLNAANEVAVEAFCRRRIPFLRIAEIVREVLDSTTFEKDQDLESIMAADDAARRSAGNLVKSAGVKSP